MINEGVNIKMINDKKLLGLFTELEYKYQRRVAISAMRNSGKIINKAAKQNFQSSTKGFSANNYKDILSSFKIKSMKKDDGVVIGVEGYTPKKGNYGVFKAVWLERGTEEREYTTKNGIRRSTGSITGSHFFERAVDSNKTEALNSIGNNLVKSMERLVKKFNK